VERTLPAAASFIEHSSFDGAASAENADANARNVIARQNLRAIFFSLPSLEV
jgi:hypothetical protein